MTTLSPALTPRGRLHLTMHADAPALDAALARRLTEAFERGGAAHGLLQLGATEIDTVLPPALAYLRDLAQRHVTSVCTLPLPFPPPEEGERGGSSRSRRRRPTSWLGSLVPRRPIPAPST